MPNNLNLSWKLVCVGTLMLSFIPLLGIISLILVILITFKTQFKYIIEKPLNKALGLLSLWLIIVSCLAYSQSASFLGLPNLLPFFALLATFSLLLNQPSHLRQLAWLLVIPSLMVIILGVGQLFGNWQTPPLIHQVLGWQLVPQGEPAGRMSSIFMYANILAAYTQMVFFLNLGLWLEAFKFNRKNPYVLIFLSLCLLSNGLGILLTSSRNAWVITFFGCLIFAIYLGWRLLVLGVISAASTVVLAAFGPDPAKGWLRQIIPAYFWARVSDEMYPDRPVATLRTTQWQFAWNLTQQRPWFGWGLRNFSPLYKAQMHEFLGHPHNLLLMLSAETGIIATLWLCAVVGWIFARGVMLLKNWPYSERDHLIFFSYIMAFTGCIFFNLFDVTLFDLRTNTLGWLLLSAIAGLALAQKR